MDWFELGIPKALFRYRMALLGLLVSYLFVAGYYCNNGIMNPDEGFYALAAKEVMSGAVPYRDFGYSQAPLLPYLNGALMKWIGFGWLEQRWVNALWGLATLILLAYGGARAGQPWLGLLGITALILSPFWIHYTCMGKTYAASGFWLTLATLAAVLPGRSQVRMWVFSISAAIALGCRLTVLPGVCFMAIALAARFTGIRKKVMVGGSLGACLISVFLPFYLMEPENFLFWNIHYHLGSTFDRRQWSNILEYISLAPGVWFIMLVSSCLTVRAFKHVPFMEWGFLLAAWVGVLWNLSLKSNYGENATPFVGAGLLGAMALSSRFRVPKLLYGGIFLVSFVYLASGLPKTDPDFREALWQTATCVRSLVSEEELILTPFPIVAVEADRKVPPNMTMGLFALTSEIEPGRARRLHLTSTQELLRLIGEKEPAAVVLNNFPSKWNFYWSVPSLRPANKDHTDLFFKVMEENYFMVFGKRPFAVMLRRPPYPPDQG